MSESIFRSVCYTCQPFYIYRRDIFYLKNAKIFRWGPIIFEDVRRRSEDLQRCFEEFRLTRTQEHKGILIDFPTKKREFRESQSST